MFGLFTVNSYQKCQCQVSGQTPQLKFNATIAKWKVRSRFIFLVNSVQDVPVWTLKQLKFRWLFQKSPKIISMTSSETLKRISLQFGANRKINIFTETRVTSSRGKNCTILLHSALLQMIISKRRKFPKRNPFPGGTSDRSIKIRNKRWWCYGSIFHDCEYRLRNFTE